MGSLKDEMRGLEEDHKPCEKADDGGCPGGSDGSTVPGEAHISTSQESTNQGDYELGVHINVSHNRERDENQISKEQERSAGMCDDTDQSDCVGVKRSTQAVISPLIQQPEAYKTSVTQNPKIISNKVLSDGEENQGHEVENTDYDRGKGAHIENILVPLPSTPGLSEPWSPAPPGQHHMRTQVSLEVVQCRSAATSPMTPPEDGHSFFFPGTFVRSGTVDAELQVDKHVEFCSVATSPMTPKTPSTTAFPVLTGSEMVQEGKIKKTEEQGSFSVKQSPAEAGSEKKKDLKFTSTEVSEDLSSNASPESFPSCHAEKLTDSHGTLKDSNQQSKQQKMASMDQDITIMVTQYNNEEEEESHLYPTETEMVKIDAPKELEGSHGEEKRKDGKGNLTETVAPDYVQDISAATLPQNQTEDGSDYARHKAKADMECQNSEMSESKTSCEETSDFSVRMRPVPESPSPFGCHNIRTQVSLEVVQCQSAATSPMTPPEGDHAFNFPSSFGKCTSVGTETKDAEMQVGQQVEFRSVATAPMTPRTPTATVFPEIKREASLDQKTVVEKEMVQEEKKIPEEKDVGKIEEDKVEVAKQEEKVPGEEKVTADGEDKERMFQEEGKVPEEKKVAGAEEYKAEAVKKEEKVHEENKVAKTEEETTEARNCKDKVEEPVQDVSWDEKGMTWEVYGAVVEVTVLGSAIQKHLEKQVKKRQPSMPPPPPLSPSATPLTAESLQGSTKGRPAKRNEQDGEASRRRRNPFRQMMENIQQPHCCSKAHTTE